LFTNRDYFRGFISVVTNIHYMKESLVTDSDLSSGYRIDFWTVAIILISVISIALTIYGLMEGITGIQPHLFYLPVIMLAYRCPKAGTVLAILMGILNIVLFWIFMPEADELSLITIKSLVLVGVGIITALLSAELTNKKERYEGIFSTSRSGIVLLNPETGEISEANRHFYSMLDPEEGEKGIKNIKQVWKDEEARKAFFYRLERENPQRCLEEAYLTGKNGNRNVVISAGKFSDAEAILTISDVTRLRTAEKEREEEREKAQNYLDVAAVILLVISRDLKVTMINRKGSELLGYPEKEILGKDWFEEFTPEPDKEKVKELFTAIIRGERENLKHWERYVRPRNGKLRLIRWQMVVLRNTDGAVTEFLCSGEDITEERLAELALEQSENKYRELFNNTNDIIFLYEATADPELTKFLEVNDVACTSLQYTRDEMMQIGPYNITAPDYRSSFSEIRRDLFSESHTFEWAVQRKDGTVFPVEIGAHIFVLNGMKVILCVVRNITERKRYEQELRDSLDEKEVLLREVHHRVKNNLQVICSLLGLQAAEFGEASEVAWSLHEIENRIRSMALVHEHLYRSDNLTQIDAESYISDLTSELLSSYAPLTDISLDLKIDKCSPDIDIAVPCGMILNEIISNSLKHAFEGRKKGSIRIHLIKEDSGLCRLEVGDDGIGLPPESELRKKETLGITLIETLVDQMDATLEISREGGTTYFLVFSGTQR